MTKPFRVLYVGPAKTATSEPPSLEQQSRAVQFAGGTVVRYEGHDTAELIQALRDGDVAMLQGHGFDRAAFAQMGLNGRCKGLVSFGHGYDHLDLEEATRNGVLLANTASFGTEEVSNHTMMHFLVCARKFVLHDKLVRSGVWTRTNLPAMGHIAGQVFGIVGLGDIGRAVARKAKAFGLHVIAYDPYVASWDALEYAVEMADSLEAVCRKSDYLSIHVYLNAETRHLISRAQFAVMKPSAYLINCARGGVVDETALIEALQQKRIAGAGLDVFEKEPISPDNPMIKMDNVILTPHLGACNLEGMQRMALQVAEGVWKVMNGQRPDNPVVN